MKWCGTRGAHVSGKDSGIRSHKEYFVTSLCYDGESRTIAGSWNNLSWVTQEENRMWICNPLVVSCCCDILQDKDFSCVKHGTGVNQTGMQCLTMMNDNWNLCGCKGQMVKETKKVRELCKALTIRIENQGQRPRNKEEREVFREVVETCILCFC